MNYYASAYIGLVLCSLGVVSMPVHIAAYRERRVLRRFRASSLSIWTVLGSQIFVNFVIAIFASVLLSVISLVWYDAHPPDQFGLFIPAFILATLCFSAFGFFLGAILPTTRAAQGIGIILFFVMMILGGAGPPREVLSKVMLYVSNATPIWYVIQILQDPWLGYGWNVNASLIVVGITALSTILSARFFRWE